MDNVGFMTPFFDDSMLTISFKVVEVTGLEQLLVSLDTHVPSATRSIRSACQELPLDQVAAHYQAAPVHLQAQQDLGAALQRPPPRAVQLPPPLGTSDYLPFHLEHLGAELLIYVSRAVSSARLLVSPNIHQKGILTSV
jgi:hypothetical protein